MTLIPLTAEQVKRVISEIANTERRLNKELSRSKDLQYKDEIEKMEKHIAKLNGMIVNGWNAPRFQ